MPTAATARKDDPATNERLSGPAFALFLKIAELWALTPPEARLWNALRGRAVDGLRFRRQHPIGPFILDFYCVSARLAVEVDGAIHTLGDNPARDDSRDLWLERHGITVLRIEARHVLDRLDAVLTEISCAAAMAEKPWEGGGPLRRPAGDTSPLRGK